MVCMSKGAFEVVGDKRDLRGGEDKGEECVPRGVGMREGGGGEEEVGGVGEEAAGVEVGGEAEGEVAWAERED